MRKKPAEISQRVSNVWRVGFEPMLLRARMVVLLSAPAPYVSHIPAFLSAWSLSAGFKATRKKN